jgi:hypothetical protein
LGKKNNEYLSLSEQQIFDCSISNEGCNGGDPQYAYTDIMSKFPSQGIYSNDVYPVKLNFYFSVLIDVENYEIINLKFTGAKGTCQNKNTTFGAVMTNWIIGEGQSLDTYGYWHIWYSGWK